MPAYNRYCAHLSMFLAKGCTNITVFWKILTKYIPRHSLGDRYNMAHSNFPPKYPAQRSCCPRPNLRSANVSLPKPKKNDNTRLEPRKLCALRRLVLQQFAQHFTLWRCQLQYSLPNSLVTSDRTFFWLVHFFSRFLPITHELGSAVYIVVLLRKMWACKLSNYWTTCQ